MNQTPETTAIRRHLPAIGEFFHAVSGLVAIFALLAIVVSATRLVESADRLPIVAPAAAGPQAIAPDRQTLAVSASLPTQQETMVFYLVTRLEQEFQVDWGENVDTTDHWRRYQILYARDPTELQTAHQTVVGYMLSRTDTASVRLIDARAW